jgi:magnesium-transporting ATPase (P-type)
VVADKTGTITQNQMEFRKMSIGGVSYGQNHKDCEDAHMKEVTNFNMVDSDLNKAIKF